MERVYNFVINIFFYYASQYLFVIKVICHVWNTAEYITTFIAWDLRNL